MSFATFRRIRSVAFGSVVGLLLGGLVTAVAPAGASQTTHRHAAKSLPAAELALVSYSTPQAAFTDIISAFQKTTVGKNITFTQSYGASGDQSRAVLAGQPADVVEFSLAPDITRLVDGGIVDASWDANQYQGFVTKSVVVIATRSGNPKGIKDWPDLVKKGVEVITPNPFTSGGARWNVMAAYGANSKVGKNNKAGVAYLNKLFKNVPVQDDSARVSLQTFTSGKGDALLSYENDAIFAQQNNVPLDYVIPKNTILIENPVAVTKTSKHPKQAKHSSTSSTARPRRRSSPRTATGRWSAASSARSKFKTPSGLFTIDQLGGWTAVTTKFFDPNKGIVAGIERGIGVATSK